MSSAEPLFVGPGPSCRGPCAGRAGQRGLDVSRYLPLVCDSRHGRSAAGQTQIAAAVRPCGARGAGRRELAFPIPYRLQRIKNTIRLLPAGISVASRAVLAVCSRGEMRRHTHSRVTTHSIIYARSKDTHLRGSQGCKADYSFMFIIGLHDARRTAAVGGCRCVSTRSRGTSYRHPFMTWSSSGQHL